MTLNEAKETLATISYKPDSGLQLSIYQNLRDDTHTLSLAFLSRNAFSPTERLYIYSHQRLKLDTLTVSRFLDIVRAMIHNLEKHEADEWILVNGLRLYNPHAE